MLDVGGYIYRCTNQVGLMLIEYLGGTVFGDYNAALFQVMNVFGITLIYKKIVNTMAHLGVNELSQIVTLCCGIIFFPFVMYTSFVYGTIWSMVFALMAIDYEVCFFSGYKVRYVWLSAFSIAFACVVKSNAVIMCIAILLYAVVRYIGEFSDFIKGIAYIITVVVLVSVISSLPNRIITQITECNLDQGMSSWSFIAMGLQDDGDSPGWSNGYNYGTYEDCQYITELHAIRAKSDAKSRIDIYKADKPYGFRFFISKIASMWTEPSYQGYWINQIRDHRVVLSGCVCNFMSARGYTVAANVLGFFQLFVFAGTILWLLLERENYFVERSLLVLSFVGGFLFHLFWEAKSQYSITYFILLIPCAVMGFGELIKMADKIAQKNFEVCFGRFNIFAVIVAITVAVSFSLIYKICGQGCLTEGDEMYESYLVDWEQQGDDESILEVNYLKVRVKDNADFVIYLRSKLDENGIGY